MTTAAGVVQVELVIARDPLLLLEQAAEAFLTPARASADQPFPSPPYLLALRQGGLRDDLIRLAAERGVPGWFDPPLCTFQELPKWLGSSDRPSCDEFERAIILGGVLRGLGGDVFGRVQRAEAFIDALDRLFGELIAEGVTPDAFKAALEGRTGRDSFEKARDAELALVYAAYLARLEGEKRRDGRDRWLDCARIIETDPTALGRRLGGRRELRLFGLQDLRGGWRTLLRALAASPALDRIAIYTAEELDLGLPTPATVTRLIEPQSIAGALFSSDSADTGSLPSVQCIAAPDVERELELVAQRVCAAADAGVPFHRIAIVARQARPYVDLALSALDRFGVPATARRRLSMREVPVVRAINALLAAAADGWSRHCLAELAEQPYFTSRLDARLINFVGYRRRVSGLKAWVTALDELAAESEAAEAEPPDEERDRRAHLPAAIRAKRAAERFREFTVLAAELDEPRKLAQWVAWLRAFLVEDHWQVQRRAHRVPAQRFDIARVDLAGWRGLTSFMERWSGALDLWGGAADRLTVAEFHAQLRDLLELDVALWTETLRGVQVLEGFAAAYRSFDHVFLVGLETGRMPLAAPASPIFEERERDRLREAGLPFEPRTTWDARERELFRVLVGGARERLTVSYALVDPGGRETVCSAFVEALEDVAPLPGAGKAERVPASQVVTRGVRLVADPGARDRAIASATVERGRRTGALTPHNGLIQAPALLARLAEEFGDGRLWSPSQLESLAKCPWSYWSARLLKVGKLEDPDEEMDPATRGTILHDALARFFDAAQARVGGPVFLRTADLEWAVPLVERSLEQALDAARPGAWLGHELLLPAKTTELKRMLRRFITWEVSEHEDMFNLKKRNAPRMVRTAVIGHELKFEDVVLERNGVRFKFRGSVDRVEQGIDDRFAGAEQFIAAVDYKTTTWSVPGAGDKKAWGDHVVLQVPLYAHAIEHLFAGKRAARIEYRAIKQRAAHHTLELHQFDRKAKAVTPNAEDQALMDGALDAVADHVKGARAGEFPAEPARSCNCPPFCHALEICRVAGGPRLNKRR